MATNACASIWRSEIDTTAWPRICWNMYCGHTAVLWLNMLIYCRRDVMTLVLFLTAAHYQYCKHVAGTADGSVPFPFRFFHSFSVVVHF